MISRSHTGSPIHCQAFLRILNAGALPPSVVTMIHLIEQHLSVFASVLQQTPSFFASLCVSGESLVLHARSRQACTKWRRGSMDHRFCLLAMRSTATTSP